MALAGALSSEKAPPHQEGTPRPAIHKRGHVCVHSARASEHLDFKLSFTLVPFSFLS